MDENTNATSGERERANKSICGGKRNKIVGVRTRQKKKKEKEEKTHKLMLTQAYGALLD